MITKTCYFYNVGVLFDKDNLELLKNVWNCNGNCCKSDLCNGLSCEDYGINFNKDSTIKYIKNYVDEGIVNTYGYIKSVDITLSENLWDDIYQYLIKNYDYKSLIEVSQNGFISFDYGEIIEEFSSYWEEPDKSFVKTELNTIEENKIHILKENELNGNTINWVNENLYGLKKEPEEIEI